MCLKSCTSGSTSTIKDGRDIGLAGIEISSMTCLVDLDFTMQQIFNKADSIITICHWPSEKILQEIRYVLASRLPKIKQRQTHTDYELNKSCLPFFVHFLIDIEGQSVRIYVCIDPEEKINTDVPAFSFCYR